MSDVFAEIDEVMRQERLQKIWQDWGSAIITGIVVLLLATAGTSAYNAWNNGVKEKQTSIFLAALAEENFPENLDLESLKMRGDLKALLSLMAAGQLVQDEKPEEALAFYTAAASQKGASSDYRDLAFMMAARLSGNVDEDTTKRLNKIFKSKKSPWRYQAAVDLAVLSFHQDQNVAAATDYLNAVIVAAEKPENKVSFTLAERAKNLLHVYETRGAQMDESTPDESASAEEQPAGE